MAYPVKGRRPKVRELPFSGFREDAEAARRWIRMVLRWAAGYHGVIA